MDAFASCAQSTVANAINEVYIHEAFRRKKKNAVTYIILLAGTTFALGAQIYGGYDLLFNDISAANAFRFKWLTLSIQSILTIYIWELSFREKFGFPLLCTRLLIFVLMQLVFAAFFYTNDIIYLRLAMMTGFYATTEQASFIALFVFRLNLVQKYQRLLFYLAIAQAFVLKTTVFIASTTYYCLVLLNGEFVGGWGMVWKVLGFPLFFTLYGAQVYTFKGLFALALRCSTAPTDVGSPHLQKSMQCLLMKHRRHQQDDNVHFPMKDVSFNPHTDASGTQDTYGNDTGRLIGEGKACAALGNYYDFPDEKMEVHYDQPRHPVTILLINSFLNDSPLSSVDLGNSDDSEDRKSVV